MIRRDAGRQLGPGFLVAAAFAVTGKRPLEAILLAQAANGVLLPIIAGFLLWVMNRAEIMGAARNRWRANLAGGAVVLLAAVRSVVSSPLPFLEPS
jgi:Mn2+/Fe2+ NRAMP family transporter